MSERIDRALPDACEYRFMCWLTTIRLSSLTHVMLAITGAAAD